MDEFNVNAECYNCGKRKKNCKENITEEDGEQKLELICKECWDYIDEVFEKGRI